MITIKILGPGCTNCKKLEGLVRKVVDERDILARIVKVTNYAEIMHYPILHTPGLVINEKLVASGPLPKEDEIAEWLTAATA